MKQMTDEQIKNKVAEAFLRADENGHMVVDMFVRWITGGFVSSQGMFIIHSISACKMTVKDYEHVTFSCKVVASTYPDFENEVTVRYVWKLTGRNYWGKFKPLHTGKKAS